MSDAHETAELRLLLQGTAVHTGIDFHRALVENLAQALSIYGAWVTEYLPEEGALKALAFYAGGGWIEDWEQSIEGTPCEAVIREQRLVHFPDRVVDLFPMVDGLREMGAVSYLGVPLKDLGGEILGHLAVLDTRPMPEEPRTPDAVPDLRRPRRRRAHARAARSRLARTRGTHDAG